MLLKHLITMLPIILQKPITRERFNQSVDKALEQHKLTLDFNEEEGEHIFVKSNLKKRKVYIKDIKWIEALVIM